MCVPVSHLLHHSDRLHQYCLQVVNCLMNQKLLSREQSYYPNNSETSTSFSARSSTLVHAPEGGMFLPFFFLSHLTLSRYTKLLWSRGVQAIGMKAEHSGESVVSGRKEMSENLCPATHWLASTYLFVQKHWWEKLWSNISSLSLFCSLKNGSHKHLPHACSEI